MGPNSRAGQRAAPVALRPAWLLGSVLALFAAMTAAVSIGPSSIGALDAITEIADRLLPVDLDSGLSPLQRSIVWDIRLPRVVLGALVGSCLAVSGAGYQGVFRNPLADPYLLGIGAGAGFGATLMIVNGIGDGLGVFDPARIAAFVGALAAVMLTWTLGVMGDRSRSTVSLLLAGVAVASFFTALQTFAQQSDSETVSRVYLWLLGSLVTSRWSEVAAMVPYAVLSTAVLLASRRSLDLMSVGDTEARSLGLDVARSRTVVIAAASLATAAAVAVSGLIAFVGLIVPHTVRLLFGSSYRVLVPLSALLGGAFLVLCDLLARTVMSPAELPIGVVTAFLGAPFFLIILRTSSLR